MIAVFVSLFKRIKPHQLIIFWLDQWAILFPGIVPGLAGVLLRTFYFKLTAKRVDGLFFVRPFVRIEHSYGLSVSKNCHINYGCYFEARGGITLGEHVLIGPNVTIVSFNHALQPASGEARVNSPAVIAPVVLGNNVWVGANAVILPGVTIGDGAIIGAGAIVTKSVEPGTVIIGTAARPV